MLNEGRLVWSKSWPKQYDWYTDSFVDEASGYRCEKKAYGGWLASISHRLDDQTNAPPAHFLVERIDLGWAKKLVDAKRICDEHHHAAILAGDNVQLKNYVKRYPL